VSPQPPATPAPTATTPTSTPTPTLEIAGLPNADLAAVRATAVCDPEPGQADPNGGEVKLSCFGGLTLALRAFSAVTRDPFLRIYLRRPTCATSPCTDDELSTGEVTGWTASQAFSVKLDARLKTVERPAAIAAGRWPDPGTSGSPAVKRESIKGAPKEVADRTPFPFCGHAEVGRPEAVTLCFRDAVIAGSAVEMIERVFGTEGGEILDLYRYDGHGPVILYERDGNTWHRQEGSMIMGPTPPTWAFEPWFGF
jgi:hypothetical protein